MATLFKTLGEYLLQGKPFVVPNYQRGYKWAVKDDKDKQPSHVEKLCDDLIKAYKTYNGDEKSDYFLQGITVSEKDNQIILIDGQQRTTTLYLLLWYLDENNIKDIKLIYDIRKQSKEYIENLQKEKFDYTSGSDDFQDIFYFKTAIEQIKGKINSTIDKVDFKTFILSKVRIIYIVIDESKAVQTFTMMNGNKATMLPEELIKAEMLRKVSLPTTEKKEVSTSVDENLAELKEIIAKDWETNAIRSRYAREWDKWLYWWNGEDVKKFFNVDNPMGLLLEYCHTQQKIKEKPTCTQEELKDIQKSYSFDSFKFLLSDKKSTKEQFKKLRDLQKSFEDIFNTQKTFNYLGLAMKGNIDKYDVINYFIDNKKDVNKLKYYSKWSLVGATHRQITKSDELREDEESKEDKASKALEQLSDKFVYQEKKEAYDLAAKQLLRLNVEEDNKLFNGEGRKFDFNIYGNKSLEHIHPKSKAYHKVEITKEDGTTATTFKDGNENDLGINEPQDEKWLNRDSLTNCTEHSIGNLLLLDKNENSKFNDKPFEEKKKIYFNVNEDFKSRNLLHTISVFANSKWSKAEIEKNQEEFIKRFEKDYEI